MKRYGVTTIAHWMTEQFPPGIKAYVESRGVLFQVKRIRSYNGSIRPVLATLLGAGPPGEFTCLTEAYTLNTAVFLSIGTDLAGNLVTDIMDAVEPVRSSRWAMQAMPDISATYYRHACAQLETSEQGAESSIPWCG